MKYTLSNTTYSYASIYNMTEERDFEVYIPLNNTTEESLKDYARYFNAIDDILGNIVNNYDTIKLDCNTIDILRNGECVHSINFGTYDEEDFEKDDHLNMFFNMHYDIYKYVKNQFVENAKKILAPYKEEEEKTEEYVDVYDVFESEDESEYEYDFEDESEDDLDEFFDELEKKREKFLW